MVWPAKTVQLFLALEFGENWNLFLRGVEN